MKQCIIYNFVVCSCWIKRVGLLTIFATTEIVPAMLAMRIAWRLYYTGPAYLICNRTASN